MMNIFNGGQERLMSRKKKKLEMLLLYCFTLTKLVTALETA